MSVSKYLLHFTISSANHDSVYSAASSYERDIALIKLSRPVTLTDDVNLICLPNKDEFVAPSTTCLSSGWGKTEDGKQKKCFISKVT